MIHVLIFRERNPFEYCLHCKTSILLRLMIKALILVFQPYTVAGGTDMSSHCENSLARLLE